MKEGCRGRAAAAAADALPTESRVARAALEALGYPLARAKAPSVYDEAPLADAGSEAARRRARLANPNCRVYDAIDVRFNETGLRRRRRSGR